MKNPNTPKFWDQLIHKHEESLLKSEIYKSKNRIVLSNLNRVTGKLIDIGAGYGYIEKLIKDAKLPLTLYGIDISNSAIEKLKMNFGKNFKIGKVTNIPYKDNYFDVALVLDVMEHIERRFAANSFMEINRVLKKKAMLIVSVPLNDTKNDMKRNGHLRKYTIESISKEIKVGGFEIINKVELIAFKRFYELKSFVVKIFPILNKRPNLVIVVARKK